MKKKVRNLFFSPQNTYKILGSDFNPSVTLWLKFQLLSRTARFKFLVRLNSFKVVRWNEVGCVWISKGAYSGGKRNGKIEVTETGEIRCEQLLDDLKEMGWYWKQKQEKLDRTLWRTRFGKRCGSVVKTDYGKIRYTEGGSMGLKCTLSLIFLWVMSQ